MALVLRWYQEEAPDALLLEVERDKDVHPIAVVPTGAGKTIIICEFINKYLSKYPTKDILVLSHVEEILEQDYEAIDDYFEGVEIGLYSAGLGSRTIKKITVAGIQSVYRKAKDFQNVGVVVIDECQLVTTRGNGMYRTLLKAMPAQYVGVTATHFRLGHGYIHEGEGALFNSKAYDLSSRENFNRLVEEGYLSELVSKATDFELDTKGLKTQMGDYVSKEMSDTFDRKEITKKAVAEIIKYGKNYKKWLIFAIDIEHAENICKEFIANGISCVAIHSKMEGNRKQAIKDVKAGKYRATVNVNVLATGFDVPDIDLIASLRPTQSPVIHVQSIGRGLRVSIGKDHCLVLDFAGNIGRLGPINDVIIKTKGKGKGGKPVIKKCPECDMYHHPSVRVCDNCGHKFVFKSALTSVATTKDVVAKNLPTKPEPIIGWIDVEHTLYSLHMKPGKTSSMLVTYKCGLTSIKEWICIDHKGYPGHKAKNWVRFRLPKGATQPNNLQELYQIKNQLKLPKRIRVDTTNRYPIIHNAEF